ncbi:flagellar biosynthetic protein FliP [Leptospira yanagawae serovar Saopaulo str. Sao Paulo = ATCC 700523]|uniref:Flagellar biosynthetic protein FliP n=1 Tax=Leptospira yanagawae serovar Saopaulo str. Sao Paulo = ATCC 700523 TaxID=1249483 RepID=A0A5E8H893_9LEPT|nr:flagellar type III secretion system pore protein FliP [Leptospira yanagawae]EOQ87334.1 flagellar biosynthetic protein FliP [Leptospira yanagawae serovar Saopaulo str. Sao Paulo = ATCC 700523]
MRLRFFSFVKRHKSAIFLISILFLVSASGFAGLLAQDKGSRIPIPNLSFNVNEARGPKETSLSLMILFLVTILSLAPAIVMSVTSFTKVVIVFDFVRRALSLQNLPPNQVMMGLALFVTFFIMAPTIGKVNDEALQPYLNGKIDQSAFMEGSMKHLRQFMIRQLGKDGTKDVALFLKIGKVQNVKSFEDVPSYVLVPAFMLSEIKKAFIIGIYIFIPFIVIDLIVASALLAMGFMMLPPVMISLPLKLILFILIDGWNLLVLELVRSYK